MTEKVGLKHFKFLSTLRFFFKSTINIPTPALSIGKCDA